MFLRSYRRSILFLIISFVFMMYTAYPYLEGPLITPPKELGFIDQTECIITVFLIPLVCFILPSKYEIELSLVCGTKTSKLFFSKALPIFTYILVPAYLLIMLYRYVPYSGGNRTNIAIYVPENYRLLMFISMFVTVFFFFTLVMFVRVISRNCYAPVFVGLFANHVFHQLCKDIQAGSVEVTKCLYDPFISVYFMGNELPNELAANYEHLRSLQNVWTYNRLLFFVLGVVLLIGTYLLLRREKLHKGFGD